MVISRCIPSSAVSDYQTAFPEEYTSRIMAKPEPTSSDYVYVLATNNSSTLSFYNSNNQKYVWNLSQGINYYYGDEPGFALNEITNAYNQYSTSFQNNWDYYELDLSKLTSWTSTYDNIFYQSGYLTNVVLPNSITSIGSQAFRNCYELTSINLPTSLTTVGSEAFAICPSLSTIELPASTTTIGDAAFNSCSGLTSITCLATTPPTLGNDVFTGDSGCPIYVPAASVSAYQSAWSQVSSRIQPIP